MARRADASTPAVLEPPPKAVAAMLGELREACDAEIPSKQLDRNLLIGTFNIRAFGDLTEKWETERGSDSPLRNLADVRALAEIVSRFDVVAIQEARANLKALRHMLKALGSDWSLLLTDVNPPPRGNGERLAFLFDQRRLQASGLAAELVVPQDQIDAERVSRGALREQFVRTPYAVSFQIADQTFILVTLHVLYGDKPEDRLAELRGIARWLADWARRTAEDYSQNLIALGDFNVDRRDDPTWQAMTTPGSPRPRSWTGSAARSATSPAGSTTTTRSPGFERTEEPS